MACPTPERLVELVEGRLEQADSLAIESHIDTCESCRIGLAAVVRGEGQRTWSLGRYRIDDVLGAGGMGIVYRAWDPSLSREVAIKVVRSDDAGLRARLAREAQSLARLNHLNVCQVHDVGTDGPELWIAMELVRGMTLRAWLATAPARDQVMAVLVGAGRGLAAAHAAGLVHRDVKPENVLVDRAKAPDEHHLRAVVSDFGLARDTTDRATRTSVLAGTPAYMAPEQLDGSAADACSDQYSFAVMAHEALTGARPRPRNQASPSLPAPLRATLDRALSDDPAARFPSIDHLVDRMRQGFVTDVPPSRRRRAIPIIAVLGLAAVGVAATAIVVGSSTSNDAPTREPPPVVNQASEAAPQRPIAPPDATVVAEPRNTDIVAKLSTETVPPAPRVLAGDPPPAVVPPAVVPPAVVSPATAVGTDVQSHVAAITRFVVAGDGKACTAELAVIERLQLPDPVIKPMAQLRSQCLMLGGQCEAGKRAARAHWQSYNYNDEQITRSVDGDVGNFCRSGSRSDRDRMLRAMYVLGDTYHKRTIPECRESYAEAKQLVDKVPSQGASDILHDAPHRLKTYAPACFARAGSCALAWTIAKEQDTAFRRDSNDFTKRDTFEHSVPIAMCVDQDQGTLTDAEIVWRALTELDRVKQVGKRPRLYCDARIDQASAALRRLGDVSSDRQLARTPKKLAEEAVGCLVYTAGCEAAWGRFTEIMRAIGPRDDTSLRRELNRIAKICTGETFAGD